MKYSIFWPLLLFYLPVTLLGQRLVPPRSYQVEDDLEEQTIYDDEDFINTTSTEKGSYVGAVCEFKCSSRLQHVFCNPINGMCECEKKYPVKLNNPYAGCSKPKRLGDQCYYKEACQYTDQHSSCIQIHHNAVCQCETGYHSVSIQKPSKRVFCAEDALVITSDFSTFAGVLTGIGILSGLICFVLHLFNQNLYGSRHRRNRFGNANLAPPILFSSDPGSLPLPILDRSMTSRASSNKTYPYSSNMVSRRASSAPAFRGVSVSASRAGSARTAAILLLSYCEVGPLDLEVSDTKSGSRRPSIASIHSSSSIKSYSTRRYEREREQKEEREMQRRLSKMTSSSTSRLPPTPSPHSTDDLLPTLEEDKQNPPLAAKEESATSFQEENLPSTSKQFS